MKELVEIIAKALVDNPEEVVVTETEKDKAIIVDLKVAPSDMGKVIGKSGRIEFTSALDDEALNAVKFFAKNEGVLFAMESAHAGAQAIKLAPTLPKDKAIIVNMSGRGDKDIFITCPVFRPAEWKQFLISELERLNDSKDIHEAKLM